MVSRRRGRLNGLQRVEGERLSRPLSGESRIPAIEVLWR